MVKYPKEFTLAEARAFVGEIEKAVSGERMLCEFAMFPVGDLGNVKLDLKNSKAINGLLHCGARSIAEFNIVGASRIKMEEIWLLQKELAKSDFRGCAELATAVTYYVNIGIGSVFNGIRTGPGSERTIRVYWSKRKLEDEGEKAVFEQVGQEWGGAKIGLGDYLKSNLANIDSMEKETALLKEVMERNGIIRETGEPTIIVGWMWESKSGDRTYAGEGAEEVARLWGLVKDAVGKIRECEVKLTNVEKIFENPKLADEIFGGKEVRVMVAGFDDITAMEQGNSREPVVYGVFLKRRKDGLFEVLLDDIFGGKLERKKEFKLGNLCFVKEGKS